MSARNPLKKNFSEAWRQTILEAYPQQLINSERGLQVHFCHNLLEAFGDRRRRLFIEPCFRSADGTVRAPDIVVCNSQRIIGVIELKYRPRGHAHYGKDLRTLEWFSSAEPHVKLANERYRGSEEGSLKAYELADDAVLCWAGVYAGPRVDIESKAEGLGSRFLCLHAVTEPSSLPVVFPTEVGASVYR